MVTATTQFPKEHASLSDGSTTINFIFTDGKGRKNDLAFNTKPYPRTALKTTTGESKYSDLEQPYFAIAQDDWTGGRGNEDFENDTSRYYDGHWVDTSKESGVVLGGRESYATGYRNMEQVMPGSVIFQGAYVATRYLAVTFEASASYTTYQCEIWLKKVGSPDDLQVELWSDSASAPNAMVASKTITAANITTDVISLLKNFVWTGTPAITATTDYWMVIDGGSAATATNHWAIGVDTTAAGKKSTDGSSWTATTYSPYYRITPAAADFVAKFFEYKRGLYMVTQPDAGGNSALYINGDRGAADDNTADPTCLEDGTKSWTNDEWIGDIVLITKGPGSDEEQPWRDITDSDTNSLVCSPDWNVIHTTATEYVILGSDKWTALDADLGQYVTDVTVAGEYIWLAQGGADGDNGLHRYRFYNKAGVWTAAEEATANNRISDKLLMINHPNEGETIYSTTTAHEHNDISIYKGKVPRGEISLARNLFHPLHEFNAEVPWDSKTITNVTQTLLEGHTKVSIAAGHTTGVAAVQNIDPLDFRKADTLVAEVKSNVALASGDYEWIYDDVEEMGKTWSPSKVFKGDYARDFAPSKIFHHDDPSGTPVYTDLPAAYDGSGNTLIVVAVTDDDYLCIGASEPFNKITWDLSVVNDVVSDMNVYYYKGSGITAVSSLTDGTETGGNTTMGQDGTMSFTLPMDWVSTAVNGTTAYWIRISPTVTLKATMSIADCYLTSDEIASNTPVYTNLTNVYDGFSSTYITLNWAANNDFIYIGHATKFNKITVTMDGTDNAVASVMTADYWNKSDWTSVTITDGTKDTNRTLYKTGNITFTIPLDWEANTVNGTEAYWLRLQVSVTLTPKIIIKEITVTRDNNLHPDIPAIVADTWTTVFAGINPPATIPDESTIKSIGLNVAVDKGACIFEIRKMWLAMRTVDTAPDTVSRMPGGKRINGLQAYAGNVDDPILNPWIFTTDSVYEMQTQNDDQIVEIPLEELGSLQSSENGLGHTVNGTYIYFNIGEKIERYFNRTLDDIGPDRDEGLPSDRPGIPKSLASYPGRVYAAIDANTGTSSALAVDGTSWHEVYRAPRTSERIKSTFVQAIPGTNVDRLWISMGSDILWLPISLNPYSETDFDFTHEGHLITSYIYAGMLDVVKLWKSLKVFGENYHHTDTPRDIIVDYQTDVATTWTEIGTFDTAPVEEINIATTLPQAKRIRYRLRFITRDKAESPRLKALVTEGVAFVPVKEQYSWTFAIKQTTEKVDLFGIYDDSKTSLQDYNQLKTWANEGTPLTLRHHSALHDNKTVFMDPVSVSPIRVVDHEGIENHVAQLNCIEV